MGKIPVKVYEKVTPSMAPPVEGEVVNEGGVTYVVTTI